MSNPERDENTRYKLDICYKATYLDSQGNPQEVFMESNIDYPNMSYTDFVVVSKIMSYTSWLLSDLGAIEIGILDPPAGAKVQAFDAKLKEKLFS